MGDILSHTLEDKTGHITASSLNALQPLTNAYSDLFSFHSNNSPLESDKPDNKITDLSDISFIEDEKITVFADRPDVNNFPIPFDGGIPYYGNASAPDEIINVSANGSYQTYYKAKILSNIDPTLEQAKKDIALGIQQFQGNPSTDAGTQQWINTVADMVVNLGVSESTVRGWIANNNQTHNAIVHTVVNDLWKNNTAPYGLDTWANGNTAGLADVKRWAAFGTINFNYTFDREGGTLQQQLTGYYPGGSYGLTVSHGVDLSRHTEQEIRSILGNTDIERSIINKINALSPDLFGVGGGVYGIDGSKANAYVGRLNLTQNESESLGQKVYEANLNIIRDAYDKANQNINFDQLPIRTRTAIIDLSYPWGPYFGQSSPPFAG